MKTTPPNLDDLFHQAAEINDPSKRAAFLDAACGADASLRQEIEALLRHDQEGASFLESPPAGILNIETAPPTTSEFPGAAIGRYKLLEQIGEGGMGVVYVAEQTEPVRRRVALKIIKPGMDTKQVIARFEAERQALAMMDHPNIAKILDAGTVPLQIADCGLQIDSETSRRNPKSAIRNPHSSGRPYFVMELVRGLPITDYCDKARLSPPERLKLFVDVCHAVQHAHQKGVIHRDLKPSNVMVTVHDGRPVAKVIDFGVAKAVGQQLTERTVYTAHAQLVGTPVYMSPEQADLSSQDVDTRSDVYSLGVLLYELLTGQPPFDKETLQKAGFDEMRRIIREEEPETVSQRIARTRSRHTPSAVAPSSIALPTSPSPRLSELDWIVMKALEKAPSRRYESASAFAADIQRYLSDEPVLACPPTTMYRFQKFARKHKAAFTTAAAIAVCLILGTTVSAWQAVRATTAEAQANANATQAQEKSQEANTQRDEAQKQRDEVRALNERLNRTLYAAHMNLAGNAWEKGSVERVLDLLKQHRPKPGETDLRGFEWYYLDRLCHSELLTLRGHVGAIKSMAGSPDGKRLVSGGPGRTEQGRYLGPPELIVWDADTGKQLLSLQGHKLIIFSVLFSPDGKRIASGSFDGQVKLWDAATGRELLTIEKTDPTYEMAISPDGGRLAAAGGGNAVKVYDTETGNEVLMPEDSEDVWGLTFSPDGRYLAGGAGRYDSSEVKIWDAQTGRFVRSVKGHGGRISGIAYSPDGKRLASCSNDGTAKISDAESGEQLVALGVHADPVRKVAFSPDGQRLAGNSGGVAIIWDSQTGKELFKMGAHEAGITGVAFSPGGDRLVTASQDKTLKIWDLHKGKQALTISVPAGDVPFGRKNLAFSPDGLRVAAGSGSEVKLWDVATGRETLALKSHTNHVTSLAFSPDGKQLATSDDLTVRIWDVQAGRELLSVSSERPGTGHQSVAFSPDGKRLATALGAVAKVWDTRTGNELLSLGLGGSIAFSPSNKQVAAHINSAIKVWNAQSGELSLTIDLTHTSTVSRMIYSPDGNRLATASLDGTTKVWDAHTGQELLTLEGHAGVYDVAYSPDGKRIATCSSSVKIWDASTGEELQTITGDAGTTRNVCFSPDGHRLAGHSMSAITIYDATPLPEISPAKVNSP